jgi:hypothetical protein
MDGLANLILGHEFPSLLIAAGNFPQAVFQILYFLITEKLE